MEIIYGTDEIVKKTIDRINDDPMYVTEDNSITLKLFLRTVEDE